MESELDPDRIGRIGERQFETLCERSGLYCNKSAVDVMGWDFIVARFKFDAFWGANDARMAVDILLKPKSEARFEFQTLEIDESSPPPEGLYFNSTSFADTTITFSAKVFFEKTDDPKWRYRSTGFEALDVRPKVDDLEEYGMDQATASDLKLLINPRNITLAPRREAAGDPDTPTRQE